MSERDSEREHFLSLLDQIEKRCRAASIPIERDDFFWTDFEIQLTIKFPDGDGTREIAISTIDEAEDLLAITFEDIVFLPGYHAAIYRESKAIFGRFGVVFIGDYRTRAIYRRDIKIEYIAEKINEKLTSDNKILIKHHTKDRNIAISLSNLTPGSRILFSSIEKDRLEINISGLSYDGLAEARSIFEDISNALFFQIEQDTSIAFGIGKVGSRATYDTINNKNARPGGLSFPKFGYDKQPMTLYWHAVGASQMPLMRFLSFYQAIEYYFQRYTDAVAKKRVSSILKRPNFRADRSEDIDTILSAARFNAVRGFSKEEEQLKNVITECISIEDLVEFARENKQYAEFIRSEKIIRAHQVKINVDKDSDERQSPDIFGDVAKRVYEIRCRIVHAKGDPDYARKAPILPYTPEELALSADIAFIKFIAVHVITASADTLLA